MYQLKSNVRTVAEASVKSTLAVSGALGIAKLMGSNSIPLGVGLASAVIASWGSLQAGYGRIEGAKAAKRAKKHGNRLEVVDKKGDN